MIRVTQELSISPALIKQMCNICSLKILHYSKSKYAKLGLMSKEEFMDKVFFDEIEDRENWKIVLSPHLDLIIKELISNLSIELINNQVCISHEVFERTSNEKTDALIKESSKERLLRWLKILARTFYPIPAKRDLNKWLGNLFATLKARIALFA